MAEVGEAIAVLVRAIGDQVGKSPEAIATILSEAGIVSPKTQKRYSPQNVRAWLRGDVTPPLPAFLELARMAGVSIDAALHGESSLRAEIARLKASDGEIQERLGRIEVALRGLAS